MTVRVFVLGHRGMLGHVVARLAAERGYAALTSDARYGGGARDPLVEAVRASRAQVVFNCLGCTPMRSAADWALTVANALFPLHLAARLLPDQHLIHASTDCVFDGTRGGYRVDDAWDAKDAYGFSKLLGEAALQRPNVSIIRTSIVGPNPAAARGLMAWFLTQPPAVEVPGYINHRWNGVTTLDWAEFALARAEERIAGAPAASAPEIVQPATDVITKYELLCALRDTFAPGRRVRPVAAAAAIDRSLIPTHARAPIAAQLAHLRAWYPMETPQA
jgi:dTDP-4-dehydrorhamnose reductase